jgi:hypothetical protein
MEVAVKMESISSFATALQDMVENGVTQILTNVDQTPVSMEEFVLMA